VEPVERLRLYAGLADTTRRWIGVMDTKAGFISALNGALLSFMWIGAHLSEVQASVKWLALTASVLSLLALLAALSIIIPRQTFSTLIGRKRAFEGEFRPFSFYGYVATRYSDDGFSRFEADLARLDEADFSREALEQHFTVSRIVEAKSERVTLAVRLTMLSMALAGIGLIVKTIQA
jgi:hypothetical protein